MDRRWTGLLGWKFHEMSSHSVPSPTPTLVSWSSGKDSAWALHRLRQDPGIDLRGLLTSVNATHDRVAMHGVRRDVLGAQAEAVGLPLIEVPLPHPCSNEVYEERMGAALARAAADGVRAIAFGDLYLEDVRRYRESQVEAAGLTPLFPLWGQDTSELAWEMLEAGVRAVLTCVDPRACPASLAGREYDHVLLADLPPRADPCAENGEFHTLAYAGPAFARPLALDPGPVVERGGFVFADFTLRPG